jgi:uncharacterized membrane protein
MSVCRQVQWLLVCATAAADFGYFTLKAETLTPGVNGSTLIGGQMLRFLPNQTTIRCKTAGKLLLAKGMLETVEVENVSWAQCEVTKVDICANKLLKNQATSSPMRLGTAPDGEMETAGESTYHTGVALAITMNWAANTGYVLQKVSLAKSLSDLPFYRQPRYICGFFIIMVTNIVGNFVAMALAPASIVTPLGASSLVANTVNAKIFLKESIAPTDIVGNMLIMAGMLAIIKFGSEGGACYALDDFITLYSNADFLTYLTVVCCTVLFFKLVLFLYDTQKKYPRTFARHLHILEPLHRLALPALAGIIGGHTNILSKQLAEIVKLALEDPAYTHQLSSPWAWVILLAMLLIIGIQSTYTAYGLREYPQSYVVPVFQAFFILTGTVGSLVYFQEWHKAQHMHIWGLCILLCGVSVISLKPFPREQRTDVPPTSEGAGRGKAGEQMAEQEKHTGTYNASPRAARRLLVPPVKRAAFQQAA